MMGESDHLKDEYRIAVESNADATFFNSLEWLELVSSYTGASFRIKKVQYQDLELFIVVFQKRRKLFPFIYNSLIGSYGGLITNQKINVNEEKEIVNHIFQGQNYHYVGNPFLIENYVPTVDFTQVLNLANYSESSIHAKHLASIRKAKKYNLEIEITENRSDWGKYYQIYEEQRVRRGSSSTNSYTQTLFDLIYGLPEKRRKLWTIKKDDEIIGGAIFFYFNRVTYWHAANDLSSRDYGGSHLLHSVVINDAQRKGYKIYDFCPSGGHAGVEKFKSRFNTEKLYFQRYKGNSKLYNIILNQYLVVKSWFR